MPKLPSLQGYGLAQAPTPQPQLAPNPQGLGEGPQQAANMAMRSAMQPNPLQQASVMGTELSEQILQSEERDRKREDAVARSLARSEYFMQADELFVKGEDGITSKEGMDGLVKQLDELRQNSIKNYKGSDEGRQEFATQLLEAHGDYFRRALTTRQQAIGLQLKNETIATTNRLAAQTRMSPAMLDDMLNSADTFTNDVSAGMSPAEKLAYSSEMRSELAYSAIDGLLLRGHAANAEAMFSKVAPMMTPVQQGMALRGIRSVRDAASEQPNSWEFGPDGVYRNKMTGEQKLPGPEIQQYYAGQKAAGGTNVNINQQNESHANRRQVDAVFDEAKKYRETASVAEENSAKAEQIDKLLEGIPSGTFPAEMRQRLSALTGINTDELSSAQVAAKMSTELVIEEIRKLAPVSDSDRRYVERASPGFWQTPEGRKGVVYIMKRQAQFARKMEKVSAFGSRLVSEGKVSPGRAAEVIAKRESDLRREFASTFDPPRFEKKAAE